jgi:transposase InsO family protein
MGLAQSTYYHRPRQTCAEHFYRDCDLRDKIEMIQAENPGYGYRRIYHVLLREGTRVNAKRIRRVMKENSLRPIIYKTFKVQTTNSKHGHRIYPNKIKGKTVTGLNQVWVTDLSYIRILTAFVYVAVILDLYSRRVIGWAVADHLGHELCLAALREAIKNRKPSRGCIHHSDRGVQYACDNYVSELKQNHFTISMSAKGNPYDNAHMESFFKSMKYEEVHLWNYETIEDVLERLPFFIEDVYNKKRLHSSLGYKPPVEFEQELKSIKHADRPALTIV